MSTITLIILAVTVSLCAVAALWLIRWREQQRLEKARLSVSLMDYISLQHQLVDALQHWLQPDSLRWLASGIIGASAQLAELNLPVNSKIRKAVQQTSDWLENPPMHKQTALPQDDHNAKHLRKAVQQQIELVKESYQEQRINRDKATLLLNELRILNVKVVVTVFVSRGRAALSMNNASQAELQLNKAIKTIKAVKRPTEELTTLLHQAQELLGQIDTPAPASGGKLAEAAEQMNEDEESWKKKHF